MTPRRIQRALISVHDKTGIVDFARALHEEFGVEIISTGGTASRLKENHIPVTRVEEITGFGEMLDGRVKTLHPKIFGAILADRDNPEHMQQLADAGIEPIDMVVVNLYPFEETVAEPDCTFENAIEMIDIGGPCLLRAAAKNHEHVTIVDDPKRYEIVVDLMRKGWLQTPDDANHEPQGPDHEGRDESHRKRPAGWATGAARVFSITSKYDRRVSQFLYAHGPEAQGLTEANVRAITSPMNLPDYHAYGTALHYGENPHQEAQFYLAEEYFKLGLHPQAGPEPSFNNLLDGDAAARLCRELTRASLSGRYAVVFVKHTNPCGCAIGDDPIDTYRRAYLGDPIAAAGGALCVNFRATPDLANAVVNSFQRWGKEAGASFFTLDVLVVPDFYQEAIRIIRTPTEKRTWGVNCRILWDLVMHEPPNEREYDFMKIAGGLLIQTPDLLGVNEQQWKVVTRRHPTLHEMNDLRFAWLIAKHTKSNAVSLVRNGQLIGNGAGQMSRVMSCRVATWLARENGHLGGTDATMRPSDQERPSSRLDSSVSPVAASDAFFPFRDGPDILIDAGVTAIIQPGGSKRDAETIAACNERGVAMVFTHTRHLRH